MIFVRWPPTGLSRIIVMLPPGEVRRGMIAFRRPPTELFRIIVVAEWTLLLIFAAVPTAVVTLIPPECLIQTTTGPGPGKWCVRIFHSPCDPVGKLTKLPVEVVTRRRCRLFFLQPRGVVDRAIFRRQSSGRTDPDSSEVS